MTQHAALQTVGVSKTFGSTRALQSVDLEIRPGQIHALLGENGSGKSTFIKVLSGYHRPDGGSKISIAGKELVPGVLNAGYELGARFVHQDLALISDLSVADNFGIGSGFPTTLATIRQRRSVSEARKALERIGLDLDPRTKVRELSAAERTGVAIARALRSSGNEVPSLLVLDEPTAALPYHEVSRLLEVVSSAASQGAGILYVTHRLDEVFAIAHQVSVLRDGLKVATTPTEGITRDDLVHMMVGTELEEVSAERVSVPVSVGRPALEVTDLACGPLSQVDVSVRAGEIVGVAGITGSGYDALAAAIFGAVERDRGEVTVNGHEVSAASPGSAMSAGVGYLPADRRMLGAVTSLSARENLTLADLTPFWRLPVLRRKQESAEVKGWFERLSVRPYEVERTFEDFSGGNQQKILLAKWLRCTPAVLLLDEPTQGVDVAARAQVHHEILRAAREGAAVLVSSSDVEELVALCQRIIVIRGGRIARELTGDLISVVMVTRESLASVSEAA